MSHFHWTSEQSVDNTHDEDFFAGMSIENQQLIQSAFSELVILELHRFDEETKEEEPSSPSKRHKIRMNRLFRERVGGAYLPFPEIDTPYERVRSQLVKTLKINAFFECRNEHTPARKKAEKHRQVL